MRLGGLLGALVLATFTGSARAADPPPPPEPPPAAPAAEPPPPPVSPPPAPVASGASLDALQTELARQAAALRDLRASLDEQRASRLLPALRFSGFLQVDWVVHNQASQNEINGSGALLNQDRFTLRRGHVRVDAEKGLLVGALEVDANTTNGPQLRPIDAEVGLRWPEKPSERLPSFLLTLGLMRIPFGHEVQELDYVRPFLERSNMLQALFPGEFDLGVRLRGKYRFLDLGLALMNGSPIGSKVFPDLAPVAAKDLVGRVGVDMEIARGLRLQAGVSADTGTGFHEGTPPTKDALIWQDQNGDGLVEPNEIVAVGGTPATPSQTFHRFAVGGDARLTLRLPTLGDLSVRAEVVDGQNLDRGLEVADPVGAGRDLREHGWSVGSTLELTRWAMIGARYDVYNPDADASQQRAVNLVPVDRTYATFALMAMARYEGGRLLLEYDVNKNPLGLSASGVPTTLAANALTLRGQVVF